VGDDAPAAFAEDPLPVGVVDVRHGPVLLSEFCDLVEGRYVTVHGEDAICDYEDSPVLGVVLLGIV
jgi:hypothetical protein